MNLTTNRFYLKEIEASDIDFIYKGLSDPLVIKHYGVSFSSKEATREQMKWYADLKKNKTGIWWGIYLNNTDEFCGAGGYNDVDSQNRKAEIGFWLYPSFWGKGILKEVMPLMFTYGFEQLNLNRIEGFVDHDNKKCKKALEKVHFTHEGTMWQSEFKDGVFLDIDIYAKLKSNT